MVLFIGQVASDQRDREAFQEVDYRQMFGPGTLGIAKWVGEVTTPIACPSTWPRVPRRDAGATRSGRARVARGHAGDADSGGRAAIASSPRSPRRRPARCASVRELLAAAERPFVIAGGSGWTASACAALERFAERWQLPVGCAFRFQDVFDNRHPNYAGDVGIGINPKLAARVRDADLMVAHRRRASAR